MKLEENLLHWNSFYFVQKLNPLLSLYVKKIKTMILIVDIWKKHKMKILSDSKG